MKAIAVSRLLLMIGSVAIAACIQGESGGVMELKDQDAVEAAAGTVEVIDLVITGSVSDLSPLASLEIVRNSILIQDTTQLNSLNGLENVRAAETPGLPGLTLRVLGNSALNSVSSLSFETANTVAFLGANRALQDIMLPALREVNVLDVVGEPTAASLVAEHLVAIHETLTVNNSPQLCTIELPSLAELGGISSYVEPNCWSEEDRQALLEQAGQP